MVTAGTGPGVLRLHRRLLRAWRREGGRMDTAAQPAGPAALSTLPVPPTVDAWPAGLLHRADVARGGQGNAPTSQDSKRMSSPPRPMASRFGMTGLLKVNPPNPAFT